MLDYPFTPEQTALLTCARTTWDRRRTAKLRALSFGEETITETILMDLAVAFPGRLEIVQFSKNQEGKRGADWAWAFRDATGTKNLPMLVQAKLLDRHDRAYPEIARFVGKKLPAVRQIDRLIATAARYRWPALYAFYNHLDNPGRIPDRCGTIPNAGLVMPESWAFRSRSRSTCAMPWTRRTTSASTPIPSILFRCIACCARWPAANARPKAGLGRCCSRSDG